MKQLLLVFTLIVLACPGMAQNATPIVAEMLKNGGFESVEEGRVAEWRGTPLALSSSQEHKTQGTRSLQLSSDKEGFNPIATQHVTEFEHGQTYRLQYRARAAKFLQEYRVYVGVWDNSEKGVDMKWVDGIDAQWRQGGPDWQQVSVDFKIEDPKGRLLMIVMECKGPGTVWFDQISLGKPAPQVDPPALAPFVGSPQFVQITPERTFRVQGKPFFPVAVWGWHPDTIEGMRAARDAGFNLVMPDLVDSLGADGFRLWLDTAQQHGLMVNALAFFGLPESQVDSALPSKTERMRSVLEPNKDHPALFSYVLADEPAWGGHSVRAFAAGAELIRSIDPKRPIVVNHAPRNTIEELRRYNKYVDVAGSDIYPVWKDGKDRHSDLPNKTLGIVGDEVTKNLEALDNRRPVIQTIQGFSWSDGPSPPPGLKDEPYPSPLQLRFMAYHAIVRGAGGVAFYQDGRYTSLKPELKPIARELNAMSDLLAGGKNLAASDMKAPQGLEWMVKEWDGHWVAIVVNSTNAPIQGNLTSARLKGLRAGPIKVLAENRTVTQKDGQFQDQFAPWEVHIYTSAANERQVLRPFVSLGKEADSVSADPLAWRAPFEALVPAGRPNLARMEGVKAIASSALEMMPVRQLHDGRRWDNQWNDATAYSYPDWAGLEFPKPVTIERLVVFSHEHVLFNHVVSDGIRDFDVQVEQGGDWKTLKSFKDNTLSSLAIDFQPPVAASRVRILIHGTNGANDWSRIRELEVYGVAS